MTTVTPLQEDWQQVMMNTYGLPSLGLVSGQGCWVVDENGQRYLDMLAGIAVNCLGHQHPAITEAVTAQLTTLGHTSNFFVHPQEIRLAQRLVEAFDSDQPTRVFLCNSGAEANEIAFKLARLTGKLRVLAHEDGFHGRTMGALALTGQPSKRAPFEPLPAGVEFFPFNDVAALEKLIEQDPDNTAAVIIEPIMGEAGVMVPDGNYLTAIRELTRRHGILMICDEVQTGMGRTGALFACREQGIVPDVVTLAKGLAGGFPIGAVLATNAAADFFTPGSHGSTFGGNPYSCAAANAVLDTFARDNVLAHCTAMGEKLQEGVRSLNSPLVTEVRGRGLLIGVGLSQPFGPQVEQAARAHGLIVNAARPSVLRLAPPLIISPEEIDIFLAALPVVLQEAHEAYVVSQAPPAPFH